MKLDLTVMSSYVPKWGVFEGLREILQNGRDAHIEHGASFKVDYDKHSQCLTVRTEGATIDRKALLMGFSTKRKRSDLIGEHGEGLILGVLALCRSNKGVIIRTETEIWRPTLAYSEKWDEVVLTFDVTKSRRKNPEKRVKIEIFGVTQTEVDDARCKIRWYPGQEMSQKSLKTARAELLFDDKESGNLYVKGVFVQNLENFHYGYDFKNVTVDRDRGVVNSWDLNWETSHALVDLCCEGKIEPDKFIGLCESDIGEVQQIGSHIYNLKGSQQKREAIAASWLEKAGSEDAIPVISDEEVKDLAFWGKYGVVVRSAGLLELLQYTLNRTAQSVIAQCQQSVEKTFEMDELALFEQRNLSLVLEVLQNSEVLTNEKIQIVKFANDALMGLWRVSQGLLISKVCLADPVKTLRVIIHELSHENSKTGDGLPAFQAEIERVWSCVANHLLAKAGYGL